MAQVITDCARCGLRLSPGSFLGGLGGGGPQNKAGALGGGKSSQWIGWLPGALLPMGGRIAWQPSPNPTNLWGSEEVASRRARPSTGCDRTPQDPSLGSLGGGAPRIKQGIWGTEAHQSKAGGLGGSSPPRYPPPHPPPHPPLPRQVTMCPIGTYMCHRGSPGVVRGLRS